ncbi:MAG: monofunctional biosynthetic peptidoglycan transglycosylase [Pseudomonadota bacterium]
MKTLRRRLLWLVLLPVLFLLLVQAYFFVQIWWWVDHNPSSTSFMRQQHDAMLDKNPAARLRHVWVPYSRISNNLKRAIIASEDSHFSAHEGVDWDALQRAYEKNNRRGKPVSGGSTITQQLAKNLFLTGERSYGRKAQELIIAYMLEFWMDKERIFEIYLNVAEWGNGVFGAEAAARHYFNVSASALGASQAARLAVMLPNPRFYDKNRGSGYLQRRSGVILRRMGSAALP